MKQVSHAKVLVLLGTSFLMSGCSPSKPLIQDRVIWSDSSPIIEAFIEYPGPEEVWGGPQDFVFHIVAKEGDHSKFKTKPTQLLISSKDGKITESKGLSVKVTRQELEKLNRALQTSEPHFKGCLTPVRVRLIREDGVLIERQSCRGLEGWPKVASEIVNQFIEKAIHAEKDEVQTESNPQKSIEVSPNIMR